MCYDDSESCDAWREREVRARKRYVCELCSLPIVAGTVHVDAAWLYDRRWTSVRMHRDCYALTVRIQLDVCHQDRVVIMSGDLRDSVREHQDAPGILAAWRDCLRTRRAEGTWPLEAARG